MTEKESCDAGHLTHVHSEKENPYEGKTITKEEHRNHQKNHMQEKTQPGHTKGNVTQNGQGFGIMLWVFIGMLLTVIFLIYGALRNTIFWGYDPVFQERYEEEIWYEEDAWDEGDVWYEEETEDWGSHYETDPSWGDEEDFESGLGAE